MPVDVERLAEDREHPVGDLDGVLRTGRVLQQDDELVPADPGDQVPELADDPGQPVRRGEQELVAHPVAQAVVDRLERVEIEEADREPGAGGRGREEVGEPLREQRPVRQVGQRVVQRGVAEARLVLT